MRKPEVLLLDEPSSALDQSSQAIVQAALERAAEGRTTLIIAHRLSTIESCDSIIVLKSGAVVERGTHAELLAKEGVYAAFRAQQTFMQPPKDVEPRRAQAVKEPERI
ncbi:atp-binding cassette sub-family b member 5 [Nannochloropsis gaditana]|uniref:Atp-binding cassette sub-family b member 5 n=1 Tax=Nannochloropsis gaditana TaxID=72520 RepID=W7T6P2_9STRA|nr:atp-binding cassette sub-family b member 5 [Nannochloropsis gaditana]